MEAEYVVMFSYEWCHRVHLHCRYVSVFVMWCDGGGWCRTEEELLCRTLRLCGKGSQRFVNLHRGEDMSPRQCITPCPFYLPWSVMCKSFTV